ncbi:hypothetical protein ACIP4Y_35530 [Streptomyces sp. NPDC088810]|uniref:hypothetical protein n=1 Tax=Streptomyces sp. NPDC088810 TaxID=3365904 RepID=UPI0037FC4907
MTRPHQAASAAVSDEALFGSEAADARYRPGLPDATIHLLAATQHGVPGPVLLDVGTTGTGQVPHALLPVLRRSGRGHQLPLHRVCGLPW